MLSLESPAIHTKTTSLRNTYENRQHSDTHLYRPVVVSLSGVEELLSVGFL
jgi:hypothetical protein